MSDEPFFGNLMVAVAEAAEVAGASDFDHATAAQMIRAWDLVAKASGASVASLTAQIAAQAHLRVADLASADAHAVKLVPGELARRRNVLPLRYTDRHLVLATANPLSQDAKREVSGMASRSVVFEMASPGDLAEAVTAAYAGSDPPAGQGAEATRRTFKGVPSGPHVLVVDDEVGQRALFRSVLEEGGFRVSVAKNGDEALEMLATGEFDLVTLDYWMEKLNGLRVLQRIRVRPAMSHVPVIVVTGAEDRQIAMSLFEAGADDFVAKPIDAPLFILRIQAVLRRRQFM